MLSLLVVLIIAALYLLNSLRVFWAGCSWSRTLLRASSPDVLDDLMSHTFFETICTGFAFHNASLTNCARWYIVVSLGLHQLISLRCASDCRTFRGLFREIVQLHLEIFSFRGPGPNLMAAASSVYPAQPVGIFCQNI